MEPMTGNQSTRRLLLKYDTAPTVRYSVLAPGLQAAIGLLEQEIINETAASDLADGQDKVAEAMAHGRNVRAFRLAQALLREQMARLAGPTAEMGQ